MILGLIGFFIGALFGWIIAHFVSCKSKILDDLNKLKSSLSTVHLKFDTFIHTVNSRIKEDSNDPARKTKT
jgi:hypothetical protein